MYISVSFSNEFSVVFSFCTIVIDLFQIVPVILSALHYHLNHQFPSTVFLIFLIEAVLSAFVADFLAI